MAKPLVIRLEAKREAAEAQEWYAERNPEAAERFFGELDRVFKAIAVAPHRPPVYDQATSLRYRLLYRFPYRVIFRERSLDIEIIAVAHTSREPGYWQ